MGGGVGGDGMWWLRGWWAFLFCCETARLSVRATDVCVSRLRARIGRLELVSSLEWNETEKRQERPVVLLDVSVDQSGSRS